jgi:subtilisin family serine protease
LDTLIPADFPDRGSRITAITKSLKAHAAQAQGPILEFLSNKNVQAQSLWISNQIYIKNANLPLLQVLVERFPDIIEEIREEIVFQLEAAVDVNAELPIQKPFADVEPGLELIQAPLAWSELGVNGTGIVVATIDSGVRSTHDMLRSNFVGDYGWFDTVAGTLTPIDEDGHGTHTMGTLAGNNEGTVANAIGVAPGAKWMTCRGCNGSCGDAELIRCAQFILCPTLADGSAEDCTKAPHLVSNSWGNSNPGKRGWFDTSLQAWKAAGIIPIFAAGNSGPGCGTIDTPANSIVGVIAVGGTTLDDNIYQLSGKGPSGYGQMKPDLTAPGQGIKSAAHTADDAYIGKSGTSMATPHVAGVVALLKSQQPDLSYFDLRKFLYRNVDQQLPGTGLNCGGVEEVNFPNHAFGYGRVNAYKSVKALQESSRLVQK